MTNTAGAPSTALVSGWIGPNDIGDDSVATALQAKVIDKAGIGFRRVAVTFVVPTSGATALLSSLTATTNATIIAERYGNGQFKARHLLCNIIAAGIAGTTLNYALTNIVGLPASISVSGGLRNRPL